MRTLSTCLFTLAVVVLAGCLGSRSQGSAPSVRTLMNQANAAELSGATKEAAQLYEQVIAITAAGDSRREQALFRTALLNLTPNFAGSTPERAKSALDTLIREYPQSDRRPYAEILADVASRLRELEAENVRLTGTGHACVEHSTLLTSQVETLQGEQTASQGELQIARDEIGALKEENLRLTNDLREKEDALRKVKAVLADWKPRK